jgi:hypothetical protein
MTRHTLTRCLLALFVFSGSATLLADSDSKDELLRLSYFSTATKQNREYFVYLPVGYKEQEAKKWPVMMFLHGHGQRGDASKDLDYVLTHGPLMEAWIHRKNIPFIIISPQLPLKFGIEGVSEDHSADPRPARLAKGIPERNHPFKSPLPIKRFNSDEFPKGPHSRFTSYPDFGG